MGRIASDVRFAELTKRQTPESVKNSYGLGFSVGEDWFGHGGAHATSMEIHPNRGIALIWMVQHAGFPGDGRSAQGIFKRWALKKFSKD